MRLTVETDLGSLEVEASTGTNLADALTRAGLNLNLACGGHGSCKKCGVHLRAGSFHKGMREASIGGEEALPSCQLTCGEGSGDIYIPPTALVAQQGRILEDYRFPKYEFAPTVRTESAGYSWVARARTHDGWRILLEHPKAPVAPLGVAVDIGTTTVAAVLLDFATGEILERASMYNQQLRRADDVASRISFCRGDTEVEEMRRLVVDETINVLIDELCRDARVAPDRILRVAAAGNTTMMHLLAGLSPATMGVLPFTPLVTHYPTRSASELGFRAHDAALADLLPSTAAYIGADIICDLLVSGLERGPDSALLVDIGTNGEIVLWAGGKLHACATAAGPAFEGAGLSHGCRATSGAIEHIRFGKDLDLRMDVIGGGEPCGLCGSAVVDFLACGRQSGLLNEFGRFDLEKLCACGRLTEVRVGNGHSHACILAERAQGGHGPISISESDIAQALKAKAAIQAGIRTLMEVCGCRDLQRLVIAGGFAHFVDLQNAAAIGLLPAVSTDRIEVIGNGSLAGAALCLLDESAAPALHELADRPKIVELNRIPTFEDHFIEALQLPDIARITP